MKGDQRRKSALSREIRALAAQIPDEAAMRDIAATVPERKRAAFVRAIEPLLKFKLTPAA